MGCGLRPTVPDAAGLSTCLMVMNRSLFGYAAAYVLALATGTALLIGALGSYDTGRATGTGVPGTTQADLVMQQAAEQGAKPASDALLVAARSLPNDKRGY